RPPRRCAGWRRSAWPTSRPPTTWPRWPAWPRTTTGPSATRPPGASAGSASRRDARPSSRWCATSSRWSRARRASPSRSSETVPVPPPHERGGRLRVQAPLRPHPSAVRPLVRGVAPGDPGRAGAPPPGRAPPPLDPRLLPLSPVPSGAGGGAGPAGRPAHQQRDLFLPGAAPLRHRGEARGARPARGAPHPAAPRALRRLLFGRGAVLAGHRAVRGGPRAPRDHVGDRGLRPQPGPAGAGPHGHLPGGLAPGLQPGGAGPLLRRARRGLRAAGALPPAGELLRGQSGGARGPRGPRPLRCRPLPQPAHLLRPAGVRPHRAGAGRGPRARGLPAAGPLRVAHRPEPRVRPHLARGRDGVPEAGRRRDGRRRAAVIRVFVVDDSAFVRKALRRVLAADPAIAVVGEAASGAEALARIPAAEPDVVTLDLAMPGPNGLAVLRTLLRERPGLRVLMLSAHTREGAEATLEALAAGAVDFVDKSRFGLMD